MPPLLRGLSRIDLTNCSEAEASDRLIDGVDIPAPPEQKPAFREIEGEAPDIRDTGPTDKPVFVQLKPSIRTRVQDFSNSTELDDLIASLPDKYRNIPEENAKKDPVSLRVFVFALGTIPLLVTVGFFVLLPTPHGLWWMPYILFGGWLILVSLVGMVFGIGFSVYGIPDLQYKIKVVGVIEMRYVDLATQENPSKGHFQFFCITAENEKLVFNINKHEAHIMSVGDVGIVVFYHDRELENFYRSARFSDSL